MQRYFARRGYKIHKVTDAKDVWLLVRGDEKRVLVVKDWRRPVGYNIILEAINLSEKLGCTGPPVVLARKFAPGAKEAARRWGAELGVLLGPSREGAG